MDKNLIIGIVVVVLLAAGGFMFYKNQQTAAPATSTEESMEASSSPEAMEESSPTDSTSSSASSEVKEFTVTGSNYKFEPAVLKVNKGDKVKITFKNTGGMHDFVIDELNVSSKTIQGGSSDAVEFTADSVGTFKYYCSVGNHRQMGMEGTLTVE